MQYTYMILFRVSFRKMGKGGGGGGGQNDSYEKNGGGGKGSARDSAPARGVGACSPRKLSFIPSEIVSGVSSDSVLYSILPK